MVYAEIILPFAGPAFYTYLIPIGLENAVVPGSAVSVQFGARKIVAGIVWRRHSSPPAYKNIKPVLSLLFPNPLVSGVQMRLWEWMSEYYMCSLGEVMRAALPALLKPSGFSAEEFAADEFRERTVRMVGLGPAIRSEKAFAEACEKLRRRAPKQYEALVEIGGRLAGRGPESSVGSGDSEGSESSNVSGCSAGPVGGEVPRGALAADAATLAALQKKGFITIAERSTEGSSGSTGDAVLPELSEAQQKALDELRAALGVHTVALLFGVPSSGKSEVSFHAIAGTLAKGRDVLLLLPEISLTTQFVGRVRRVFGERVVVYHSGLSDRRRAEAWLRLQHSGGGSLVIGTRSSVFLPMPRLGLVVVDEEQDSSYKQQDPAPRYNARDVAVVLAGLCRARVLLASATPSLETWSNAVGGKYGFAELSERWGGTTPPEVIVSDTLRSAKRGERRSHFNKELSDRMGVALERGEQVILFQNRRGMAPFVECPDCGWVPRCDHCGIPMTAHRDALRCHYCGASTPVPTVCPSCGSGGLTLRGFGTEKIEEELGRLFPSARIARLDRDSATSEAAYTRIISDFERGATDILVGTQMITKGLDFAGVSLVGVLNADNLLNHPDFRASERAYQLIAQVAGRAGRRSARGQVVIQTASPESRLLLQAAFGDYRAMASDILAERALYGYPPYSRLVSVMIRHASREVSDAAAHRFGELLRTTGAEDRAEALMDILGPGATSTERIKNEYALVFMLKIPRSRSMSQVRGIILNATRTLLSEAAYRGVTVTLDVDPQ